MAIYMRFWQSKPIERAHKRELSKSACAPGHIGDPKNKKPGGLNRFARWYKRPVRAWKLYWRQ